MIDIDRTAARAAYAAGDAATFAQVLAPLGIELPLPGLEAFLTRLPQNEASVFAILEVLVQVLADVEHGIGMWRAATDIVAIARREDRSILVGIGALTRGRPYGFAEITRWNGEIGRNRHAVARWAASPDRERDSIRVPVRAVATVADREAALLAAVIADPEDDAARLVLADHWIERGDPRGELVQLQCRLVATPVPRESPVRRTAEVALERCRQLYERDVAGATFGVRRGLVDLVAVTVPALAKLTATLFAKHPIQTLVVKVRNDAHLATLARLAPELPPTIARIVIDGSATHHSSVLQLDVGKAVLAPLYARSGLKFRAIGAPDAAWRAAFAMLHSRELGFVRCNFTTAIYEALADRRLVPALAHLTLEQHDSAPTLTPDMLESLRAIGERLDVLEWTFPAFEGYDAAAAVGAMFARAPITTLVTSTRSRWAMQLVEPLLALPRPTQLRAIRAFVDARTLAGIATSPNTAGVVEAWACLPVAMPAAELDLVATALASSKIRRVIVTGGGSQGQSAVPAELAQRVPDILFVTNWRDGSSLLADQA
ncbi:MAG: TIGR02996 domain-containing protein [Kofleriaceae bacterium]